MLTSAIQHTGLSLLSQGQVVYVGVHILNLHLLIQPFLLHINIIGEYFNSLENESQKLKDIVISAG